MRALMATVKNGPIYALDLWKPLHWYGNKIGLSTEHTLHTYLMGFMPMKVFCGFIKSFAINSQSSHSYT